ncbi:MAG: rRNA maturation RNase YbeY [Bdellovibrionales bacterium]|nr:rRNA maturation RNase YbeY [Bdellovibrionales bacterium]
MSHRVLIQDSLPGSARSKWIDTCLRLACKKLKLHDIEISVAIVNDQEIQDLNRTYRNKNKPTDVLSFGQDVFEGKRRILGDIVISKDYTRKQAKEKGHNMRSEYELLAIHGLLHLLGYDHVETNDEKIMFALQSQLLDFVRSKKI